MLPGPTAALDVEEPDHIPWTEVLPPLAAQYEDTVEELCPEGHLRCVELAINRMDARLWPQAAHCDHDAVFSLLYLLTTEEFHRAVTEDGFFDDPAFMNHWATVFADYYFRAYDEYARGTAEHVPPAWRIAFAAADERAVSGTGNMLLAMNAHINRDLPFVLANIGMTAPDGTSRKADHDRVNVFLRRVVEPAREESARRFDPTMGQEELPVDTTLVDTTAFQTVVAWREEAWRNAELLVAAPPLLRTAVAEEIEANAEAKAEAIREQTSYRDDHARAERDAYCADHWNE